MISNADPLYDDFLLSLGNAERRVGHEENATRRFGQVAAKYRLRAADSNADLTSWRRYVQALGGLRKLEEPDWEVYRTACEGLTQWEAEPEIIESLCNIALNVEEETETAMTLITRAEEVLPESVGVRVAKARGLYETGRLEEAASVLTSLREQLDSIAHKQAAGLETAGAFANWLSAVRRGEITLLHGRVKAGLEQHAAALELFEASPLIADVDPLEYASVLAKADQVGRAIEILSNQQRKGAKTLVFLASLHIQQKAYEQAKQIIAELLAQNPQDPETHRLLADTLFWAREYDQAIEKVLELLKNAPEDKGLRNSLGKSLLWVGRYDEAATMLGQLVLEDPAETSL